MSTREWCPIHGRQDFFLGGASDEGGASLFCPECRPEHPDHPANEKSEPYPEMEGRFLYEPSDIAAVAAALEAAENRAKARSAKAAEVLAGEPPPPPEAAKVGAVVHVLEYTHKFGTDLAAFASGDDASAARYAEILTWIDDVRADMDDEEFDTFKKRVEANDPSVFETWTEHTGEWFSVYQLTVQ